jgi:hypothetical protein
MQNLGEMLERTARQPSAALDTQAMRRRVRRRRGVRTVAVATSAAACLVTAVVAATTLDGGGSARLEVAAPEAETSTTATSATTSTSSTTPAAAATPTSSVPAANDDERVVQLLTHNNPGGLGMASAVTLDGDPDLDGGCVWIVTADGRPISVRWYEGFHSRFYRQNGGWMFELLNGAGEVVGRRGDKVTVGGGPNVKEPRLPRCQVSDDNAWYLGPEVTPGWYAEEAPTPRS